MINTSATAAAPAQANREEDAGGESYEQEALDNLSLALQIISDFKEDNSAPDGQKSDRKKLMAYLEIDTLLSRV